MFLEKNKNQSSNTQSTLAPFVAASKTKDSKTDDQKESKQKSEHVLEDLVTAQQITDRFAKQQYQKFLEIARKQE